jgi:hypothetical protein
MNADIPGMLLYFQNKKMGGIIVCADGKRLSDEEARAYLSWCINNGYKDLYSAPEFHKVKDLIFNRPAEGQ